MRRIVHLSDIHFGSVDDNVVEAVISKVNELEPHVLVVSGDLTQRARTSEFELARQFLDKLPSPQIVVPGNHDVPLYNVYDRLARPLDKFRRYITDELVPAYMDDEIAIVGLNTARSVTIKSGRLNKRQIEKVRQAVAHLPAELLKVIVTHHPFDLPEGTNREAVVGRAKMALSELSTHGAELFLAGHLHISGVVDTAKRYKLDNGRSALVVQAGTATSVRGRGEAQSFNFLEYEDRRLTIRRLEYGRAAGAFGECDASTYLRCERGWEAAR